MGPRKRVLDDGVGSSSGGENQTWPYDKCVRMRLSILKWLSETQDEIERFEARYVAKGFEQIYGIDFFET